MWVTTVDYEASSVRWRLLCCTRFRFVWIASHKAYMLIVVFSYRCVLSKLPIKIRNKIYDMVFHQELHMVVPLPDQPRYKLLLSFTIHQLDCDL